MEIPVADFFLNSQEEFTSRLEHVTIVIPTYNRPEKLKQTLTALERQSFRAFSVIVVDDGSRQPVSEQVGNNFGYPVTFIRQKNAGASAATNRGVEEAENGIVILFDDDILPSEQCVADHLAFHRTHARSILSGSADTDAALVTSDVERYKLYMEEQWRALRPDTESLLKVDFSNFIITTANMSFPKEVFLAVGGFSTDLRDGYDVDFGFRALLKNVPLWFDRNLKSIHNDRISLRYYAGRQRAYTESKKRILQKHPELRGKVNFSDVRPSLPKRILYAVLRTAAIVRLLESGALKWITPRSLRYRLYGSTIASLSLKA